MRCAIPLCDSDHNSPLEISFHRLPEAQALYAAWEKAFSEAGLKIKPGSVVCSKHFLDKDVFITTSGRQVRPGAVPILNKAVPAKNSLLRCNTKSLPLEPSSVVSSKKFLDKDVIDTTYGRQVRSGALPIVKEKVPVKDSRSQCYVKVCRICFSTDCKLYSMTTSHNLNKAYEKLTGLSTADEEHLPPYLCGQCADRLVECERFRSRSLRAHVMLLDVIRRHGAVTLESVQSMIRTINPASSSPSQNADNCFDLHNGQLEEVYTLTDARGDTRLDDTGIDERIDDIKSEIDFAIDQSAIKSDDITSDNVDEVKTEIDDLFTQDNVNACQSNVDEDIDVDVGTNTNYDAISKYDRNVCSSNVEEDVVDDGVENDIKENKISVEDFINEETNEALAYSAALYDHAVSNMLKITLGDDADYKNSEELLNNYIHSFVFVGEDVLWESVLREARQEISKPIRLTKTKNTSQELDGLATDNKPPHDDGGPSKGDVLRCDICSYQAVSDVQLLKHLKAHAADGSFMSDVCGYKTTSKYPIERQGEAHSCSKLYCNSCKKRFPHKKTLTEHMKEHSTRVAGEGYICDICEKLFSEKRILHHLMTHCGDESIVCDICGKKYTTLASFQKHKAIHTNRKQKTHL